MCVTSTPNTLTPNAFQRSHHVQALYMCACIFVQARTIQSNKRINPVPTTFSSYQSYFKQVRLHYERKRQQIWKYKKNIHIFCYLTFIIRIFCLLIFAFYRRNILLTRSNTIQWNLYTARRESTGIRPSTLCIKIFCAEQDRLWN